LTNSKHAALVETAKSALNDVFSDRSVSRTVTIESLQDLSSDIDTPGGIILPDQAKTPPRRGVVLAVGPGRLRDDGETRVPMELQGGERILFDRWAGTDIDVGGEELKIMREADVMALDEG